jgi:hypothetical protein
VISIGFYVTRHVDTTVVALAWSYVALRLAHSFVHLTSNRVLQRLAVFALGNFLLLGIWIVFLAKVL